MFPCQIRNKIGFESDIQRNLNYLLIKIHPALNFI